MLYKANIWDHTLMLVDILAFVLFLLTRVKILNITTAGNWKALLQTVTRIEI